MLASWAMCCTPQLSFSGTHVTIDGCEKSRCTTSSHSRTVRRTDVGVKVKFAGASPHTISPRRSAQNRNRGSSNFWCIRVALKPRSLISCTSSRRASADGAARCDSGQ